MEARELLGGFANGCYRITERKLAEEDEVEGGGVDEVEGGAGVKRKR